MAYFNPYRGMASSPGAGQNYSYGQQGSNPWFNQQPSQSSYGQPYNTNPYQAEYRGFQPSQPYQPRGQQGPQGYPGYPQAPAGKGRGMGGLRGGFGMGGGMMSGQRRFSADPWRGNNPFDIYSGLFQQRGMEKELGLDPMAAWNMPQGVPTYELGHLWQGLYPQAPSGEGT